MAKQSMKFFTPELYLRFNSQDDDIADQADRCWESAIKAYHEHLDRIRDQMSQQVKSLSELFPHDCELLGGTKTSSRIRGFRRDRFPSGRPSASCRCAAMAKWCR